MSDDIKTRHPFFPAFADLPETLPVMPISGTILMPDVQLPLNIFEPRYLRMVMDAMRTNQLIGIVQPQRNSKSDEPDALYHVGCAGRISSYNETSDGRLLIVLTGVCRFTITQELESQPDSYRQVAVDWSSFKHDYNHEVADIPDRSGFWGSLKEFCRIRHVDMPWDDIEDLPGGTLVDLLCIHLPLSPADKQALIETEPQEARIALMRGLINMGSMTNGMISESRH